MFSYMFIQLTTANQTSYIVNVGSDRCIFSLENLLSIFKSLKFSMLKSKDIIDHNNTGRYQTQCTRRFSGITFIWYAQNRQIWKLESKITFILKKNECFPSLQHSRLSQYDSTTYIFLMVYVVKSESSYNVYIIVNLLHEKFEDTKEVSQDRQCNGQKKTDKQRTTKYYTEPH